MRIKDPLTEAEEPYNLVPLTDMVFNLLIFFMCATTFAQVEKDLAVRLPRTTPFTTLSAPPQQLIVNIERDGAMVISGKKYDHKELGELISATLEHRPNTSVIVRADDQSYMHYFADVMRMLKQRGVAEARITYMESAPPAP